MPAKDANVVEEFAFVDINARSLVLVTGSESHIAFATETTLRGATMNFEVDKLV